ncbi:hypothetical protein B296_00026568 [Ensete ventricosum]|uniref:Uncharacterized protein n=1 Tax=Ensete ventricosum TaxID=4639 RepID=A0A426YJ43_ENSVE|nr:hypothetical protein B296_00026568 [Ensete ventricosum]
MTAISTMEAPESADSESLALRAKAILSGLRLPIEGSLPSCVDTLNLSLVPLYQEGSLYDLNFHLAAISSGSVVRGVRWQWFKAKEVVYGCSDGGFAAGVMTIELATRSAIMGIAWIIVGGWMEGECGRVARCQERGSDTKY